MQATQASLGNPADVTVDDDGGFYISDNENCSIRFVDTAGVMRTITEGWASHHQRHRYKRGGRNADMERALPSTAPTPASLRARSMLWDETV